MALSARTVAGMKVGLANGDAGADVATVIDANSGGSSVDAGGTTRKVLQAFGKVDAAHFLAKVNAGVGGTPVGFTNLRIVQLFGKAKGNEIIAAIAANA